MVLLQILLPCLLIIVAIIAIVVLVKMYPDFNIRRSTFWSDSY